MLYKLLRLKLLAEFQLIDFHGNIMFDALSVFNRVRLVVFSVAIELWRVKRGNLFYIGMTQFERYIFLKKSKFGWKSGADSHFRKWLWWEPHGNSWLKDFFEDFFGYSAIHGLKYISKRKLSFFERIFWVVAFVASMCGSGVMIAQVWNRYHKSPVIVSFNPTEEETSTLPFPAVTICNKSLFSKEKILELIDELKTSSGRKKEGIMEKLRLVNTICTSRESFLRRMRLVKPEEFPEWDDVNRPPSQKTLAGIIDFIFDYTQPCSQLLRTCSWDRIKVNCSALFKSIITDYGRCCVFNKIPNELMDFERQEIPGSINRERGWSYEDIMEWSKWDYKNDGFMISRDGHLILNLQNQDFDINSPRNQNHFKSITSLND